MTKKEINVLDYAGEILKRVNQGVLLTTKAGDRVNTMAISWGTLGIEWNRFIFTTFVRQGRFTREQLDKNPEFVISIPQSEDDKKIIGFCGSHSGRDTDKIKAMNLTLVKSDKVSVPAIKELPLTLECKVAYHQLQDVDAINNEQWRKSCYPQDKPSTFSGANRDAHIAFYGEIVKAYIIED
ncbi:MAG: flavin reductase family protein [Prevotella sp.]|jgi:flavin reductase (DIM6/NTAB) family NADH-FMN oxidoreductase RutF|nr:flavin reductase family protein [Prevotella sp.]MCH3995790.1 flavin reductase family protein [Prevotella sp.]MCI1245769.1 flavin reductase family protein [Prevotella sp.]